MRLAIWLAMAAAAAGQTSNPAAPATEDPIARQRAAIEVQRASVKRQLRSAPQPTAEFFTVPWTEPLIELPSVEPIAEVADCDPVPENQIGPMVKEASQREGLTPDLLRAVIDRESSYRPCAVSSSGAEGLMQLMPETAAGLGVEDPFDPRQNVDAGAKYLKQMLERYGGDLMLALAAYNAGPVRADSAGATPLPPQTTSYVSAIMQKIAPPAIPK
jgi:soluble lytic murein transglycosylase-like protein